MKPLQVSEMINHMALTELCYFIIIHSSDSDPALS